MPKRCAVVILVVAWLTGCASHDDFCELGELSCVEACGGEPFLQCGACPEGSMPIEDCGDGGP